MADKNRVVDKSSLHRYRIELPILLDDMDLSVYAFRLYVHIKRRAGDGGSCYEGARALAQSCQMSAGQIAKAKDELTEKGLIQRGIRAVRGGFVDDLTILDIWTENFQAYAPEKSKRAIATPESDHHTITNQEKVITTRSLSESDHHTITNNESDQDTIAYTRKRSYSDPKNHDLPYRESDLDPPPPTPLPPTAPIGGGGGGKKSRTEEPTEAERFLIDQGMYPKNAREFRDCDPEAVRSAYLKARADGSGVGAIVDRWRVSPPTLPPPSPANGHRPAAPPITRLDDSVPIATLAAAAREQRRQQR